MIIFVLALGCGDTRLSAVESCDGVDNDGDGRTDEGWDTDGDGWPVCADCDDADPAIHPGAPERCDGVDDDCDGTTPRWEVDVDADGVLACEGDCDDADPDADLADTDLDGWSTCAGDCDDGDPLLHPEQVETCDGVDQDCDGGLSLPERDADGDGASTCDGDCDDADAARTLADADGDGWTTCDPVADCDDADGDRHPFAMETCDGVDDDCDGTVDEGGADATVWHPDADGDGAGDPGGEVTSCQAPSGWVADATDCDDGSFFIAPGAVEHCDGVDEDCDGVADDGLALFLAHPDADGDGWGDTSTTALACAAPVGWVVDDGDCNDADPDVSPDGIERCNGIDDDCDAEVDEDAVDALTWYTDGDADGWGDVEVADCAQPAGAAAMPGDCDDADPAKAPGLDEWCDGVDQDCDGVADESAVDATEWYVDADADGTGAGAPTASCTAPVGGVAGDGDCDDTDPTVGPASAESCNGTDDDCDGAIDEGHPAGAPTWYLDADGDGHGDALRTVVACTIPARFAATDLDCDDLDPTVSPDAVEVCDGVDADCDGATDDGGLCGALSADTVSGAGGDSFGAALLGGVDLEADAQLELLVSAPDTDAGSGAVYLFTGAPGSDTSSARTTFVGPTGGGLGGAWGSFVGDVDGDGIADLVLGTPDLTAGGAWFVSGTVGAGTIGEGSPEVAVLLGDDIGARAGAVVAHVGDVNGDGSGDIAIGAPDSTSGTVWLFSGWTPVDGRLSDATWEISGEDPGDHLGVSIAALGDVDGDGYDDLALGAPDRAGVGAVEVWGQTGATRLARIVGDTPGEDFGSEVQAADVDGVGGLLVTSPGWDGDRGRVTVWTSIGAGTVDVADAAIVEGDAGSRLGTARTLPDLDADGALELLVGLAGRGSTGAAALFYAPAPGVLTEADADAMFEGTTAGADAGSSVTSLGDLDGDGWVDLAIGAPAADQVHLVWGRP